MGKAARTPQDELTVLQDIVQLMTQAGSFRMQIPRVLQTLCNQLDAGRAIFFEIAPTTSRSTQLTFQRIVEVPRIGEAIEREIPRQLLRKPMEQNMLEQWMARLALVRIGDTHADTWAISALAGDEEVVRQLKAERFSQAVIQALEIDFGAFLLFPLIREGMPSGLLFFLSTPSKVWDTKAVSLARSGAQLLTHFLAQQYQENQRLLRDQFLIAETIPAAHTTKQEQQPLALIEEQKLHALITSTIPDFIFLVDIEQGKALFANTNIFLGYDIVNSENPLDIFTSKIHPDDQTEAIGSFLYKLRDAEDGEIIHSEYRMQHADGHWVWVNERAKVFGRFPDGVVKQYISVIQDITIQKEASLHVEKSEARYRNFVTYSNEGIYYVNCGDPIPTYLPAEEQAARFLEHAYLQECNETLVSMFGYTDNPTLTGVKIRYLDNVGSLVSRNDFFDELTNSDYKITNFETVKVEKTGTLSFFMNQAVGIIERDHLVGIWGVQRDITAKRLAEKALRDSELRLTSIVQDARLGVWEWQTAEQNIHINQVGLELLEIKETPSSIPLDEFIGWIADEDRTVLETALAKHVINNTDNFQVDIRMTATAGRTPRWLQFHGRLVERGTDGTPLRYSGTILNIHELKIAELLLREGEALLGAVLDAIPDTKLRVDIEGRVLSVYGAATEQTHAMLALPGILGKNLKDLFLVFIAKGLIFNAQKAISSGKLQTFEFLDSRDGVGRYYEARFNRINEREAIIILRDISPIKLFEKELNEQINKYDLKNRQLEKYIESNLQLENFAYVASHDLREPIRTMRSFGQFLDRRIGKTLDEDSRVYLDFIISSADRMNHLIEDLLTYSKVNTEPMTREAIDGQKLLSEVVNSLNTRISETHAEVVMEDIPATIYGSPSRMQQVFQNLIANAIKFHREGVPPRVVVSSSESPTHWAFSIADNGIGIPAEFFEQIFVIFKKLHNHEAYSGTGIGLALVKRIIAQHGGDIWLESKEGEGTTFFFTVLK